MNIRSVGSELLIADGRTDMTRLKSCYAQFYERA